MFPDIASSFTGSFGKLGSAGATSGGGMMIDPFTALLGAANIGTSIFSGIGAERAAARSLQAQFDAQKAGTEAGARIAREGGYAQIGENIASRLAAERSAELGYGLQKRGKEWSLTKGFPMELANTWQAGRRAQELELTPQALELKQIENRRRLNETLAERQGAMAGMFGAISPQSGRNLFV